MYPIKVYIYIYIYIYIYRYFSIPNRVININREMESKEQKIEADHELENR